MKDKYFIIYHLIIIALLIRSFITIILFYNIHLLIIEIVFIIITLSLIEYHFSTLRYDQKQKPEINLFEGFKLIEDLYKLQDLDSLLEAYRQANEFFIYYIDSDTIRSCYRKNIKKIKEKLEKGSN